jgi:hypothetical protein
LGVALLVASASDIQTVEGASRWEDASSAYERAPVLSTVGFACLGVGVAAIGGAVLWMVMGGDDDEQLADAMALRYRF